MSERRRVDLPRLLHVGADCLGEVPALLDEHGLDARSVLVGSGGPESSAVARQVVGALRAAGAAVDECADVGGSYEDALALARRLEAARTPVVIAVGGGRVIDAVKLAAARAGADLVSVPTAISHDGISSPVASLFAPDGRRRSYAAEMPAGIVVDVAVVGAAPPRTLRAGLGDLVSNLTAILDWQLAARAGRDRYDAYSAMIAESAALSVLDLPELDSADSHARLAKGLLMSGLAMAAAGTSRPCSGAEHMISHALDALLAEAAAMHGEQVALGTLVAAAAHGSPLLETLGALYARLGLPAQPADVGIDRSAVARAVRLAPATRPDRYTVLSEHDLSEAAVDALLDRAFAVAA